MTGPVDDHHDLYDLGDVLVLPRRYGGLCLPAQEAMAAGLAVVMPDTSPNLDWPVRPLPTRRGTTVRCAAGPIRTVEVPPTVLAAAVDEMIQDPQVVAALSAGSLAWARDNTWGALRARWWAELEAAADLAAA